MNPEVYLSPYTIRAMKPRTVILVRHEEVHTEYWWRNLKERDHLEDLGVGGIGKNVKIVVIGKG
jgi:hypothetical protein